MIGTPTAMAVGIGAVAACAGGRHMETLPGAPPVVAQPEVPTTLPPPARPPAPLSMVRTGEGPDDIAFTAWEPGEVLYLGVDGANLRAAPSTDTDVVEVLPVGTAVTVLAVSSGSESLIGRRNRWYRVSAQLHSAAVEGHLYGALLTPEVLRADLDRDGDDEVLTVTFNPELTLRARLVETSMRTGDDRTLAADLPLSAGGLPGGSVTATLGRMENHDGQEVVEQPLVRVRLCHGDDCVDDWLIYTHQIYPEEGLGILFHMVFDPAQLREVDGGFVVTGKPEDFTFHPAAPVHRPCAGCDASFVAFSVPEPMFNKTLTTDNGRDEAGTAELSCTAIGRVSGGEHGGKRVVNCVLVNGSPSWEPWMQFIEHSARVWLMIAGRGFESENAGPIDALEARGVEIRFLELKIDGATPAQQIVHPDGKVLPLLGKRTGCSVSEDSVVFVDPQMGLVYKDYRSPPGDPLRDYFMVPGRFGGCWLYLANR